MKYFPMFLNLSGLKAIIIGGGSVALRKARVLVEAGALVKVIAPQILPEFDKLKLVSREQREARIDDLSSEYRLAILATGNETVQRDFRKHCAAKCILVNRCDSAEDSDFITGAVVDRPPILAAVTSSGSPAISKLVKQRIESRLDDSLTSLGKLLNEIRPLLKKKFALRSKREKFLEKWGSEDIVNRISKEGIETIRREIFKCLSS